MLFSPQVVLLCNGNAPEYMIKTETAVVGYKPRSKERNSRVKSIPLSLLILVRPAALLSQAFYI